MTRIARARNLMLRRLDGIRLELVQDQFDFDGRIPRCPAYSQYSFV